MQFKSFIKLLYIYIYIYALSIIVEYKVHYMFHYIKLKKNYIIFFYTLHEFATNVHKL